MKDQNSLRKNFIWNIVGSLINASSSLFFLILATRINGINDAGIFSFAFSLSCLFQVIGTYSGRVYQVTESDSRLSDSDYIYSRIVSIFLMLIFGLLFIFISDYELYKAFVIFSLIIFKAVEAFSEIIYGVIQKNGYLYKVGRSLLFKGILGIILFLIVDILTKNLILSSLSLVFINLVILIFYDFRNIKKCEYIKNSFNLYKILNIFRYGLSTFLFTLLTQYLINVQKYSIDNILTSDNQTIFGIIVMPSTVIILCSQFLVHPFLVKLTNFINEGEINKFINLVIKLSLWLLFLGLFANSIAFFIGIPFLEFIYGIELRNCLIPLVLIITGAILFGISYILSVGLITIRKTFAQVIIYVFVAIISTFLSNYLIINKLIFGAALAYLISMLILTIMYIVMFVYCIKKYKIEKEHKNV